MLDALWMDDTVPSGDPGWQPPSDWRERWVQDIADRAAERVITRQNEVLGITDLARFRRNLDYLDGLRDVEEKRRTEGRKSTYAVGAGLVLAAAGWAAGLVSYFWGHK